MEVENLSSSTITKEGEDHDDVPLPGFRFHPTDEELVGFYLRRKVEKRPIGLELIKQADIYKYDPWDLPKPSSAGDKEWYFFCKRGRKYRNSIRPNRVTGSGFWKATGIDRPIYSTSSSSVGDCIGLKKSLVYYRGSAGKGTKTDWMMHEFRLPATHEKSTKPVDTKGDIAQEAEVWTLCRIFKRNVSYRKCIPDWRSEPPTKRSTIISPVDANSKTCSLDSSDQNSYNIINFSAPVITGTQTPANQHYFSGHYSSPAISQTPSVASSFSSSICGDQIELLRHTDWEDLRSVVDFASPFY